MLCERRRGNTGKGGHGSVIRLIEVEASEWRPP
jgi:hypothetical protein